VGYSADILTCIFDFIFPFSIFAHQLSGLGSSLSFQYCSLYINAWKGKACKLHHSTGTEALYRPYGPLKEQRYSSTVSWPTTLEVGEGSASRPGRSLPPEKSRYPLYRRLGRPQGRSYYCLKVKFNSVGRISNIPLGAPAVELPPFSHWTGAICNISSASNGTFIRLCSGLKGLVS